MKLPLRRGLTEADLDPIGLPVLLIALSRRKDLSGTLELSGEHGPIEAHLVGGAVSREGPAERETLLGAFAWTRGVYRLHEQPQPPARVKPASLLRIAIEGIREVLRRDTEQCIEAALGNKLRLAPKVSARGTSLAEAVGFWPAEKRFLVQQCNGALTGLEAMKAAGVSRLSALQVLFVLELFGEVAWAASRRTSPMTTAEQVESRATEIAHANYFELLGVHWTADDGQVEAAYQRVVSEYGAGTDCACAAPQAARALVRAATSARDTLSNPELRIEYLRVLRPGFDLTALDPLGLRRSANSP
jgi:hypothetical protein